MTSEQEAKREEAKSLAGVWYDQRGDKFVAEIYIGGKRQYLGSHSTALEASDAYQRAKSERPPIVKGGKSGRQFPISFAAFLDSAKRDDKGFVATGNVLTYDGQDFELAGTSFVRVNKRPMPMFDWRSKCQTCGAEYQTRSATSATSVRGITRNCEEHAWKGGFQKKSERGKDEPKRSVTERYGNNYARLVEVTQAAAEELAGICDSVTLESFLAHCREGLPKGATVRLPLGPFVTDQTIGLHPRFTVKDERVVFTTHS